MKRILSFVLIGFISFSTFATSLNAPEPLTKENIETKSEEEIEARKEFLESRLQQIETMDFSSMEKAEKKELKKEVKAIEKEMGLDNRISISIGGAIIIVLLLILLL